MRKEFIVERQGKAFCLYAGLLDLAHQQGLKSVSTEIVQAPSEANNRIAICTASVVLERDGVERRFTGIGDAAPNNVAPAMQTCLLRMAETRAKARALRDAVNIGVAAFEELGDDDAHDGAPERGYAVGSYRSARPERPTAPARALGSNGAPGRQPTGPRRTVSEVESAAAADQRSEVKRPDTDTATETQVEAIRNLCRRHSADPEALAREKFSAESLAGLTHAQAGEIIRELNGRSAGRAPAAA